MLYRSFKKFLTLCKWLVCPPFCFYCKRWLDESTILCSTCFALIKPVVSTTIFVTAKTAVRVFAISEYQDPIKSLILAKIQSNRLASRQLGELIWKLTPLSHLEFDYIVPIPLHWTRYAYRGFNQADEIARVIAKKSGKPILFLLKRNRKTLFQSSLSREKRDENVANVFSFALNDKALFKDKRFLLVDDLITTGATLKSAARLMLDLKPQAIDSVVASRTL